MGSLDSGRKDIRVLGPDTCDQEVGSSLAVAVRSGREGGQLVADRPEPGRSHGEEAALSYDRVRRLEQVQRAIKVGREDGLDGLGVDRGQGPTLTGNAWKEQKTSVGHRGQHIAADAPALARTTSTLPAFSLTN